MNKPLFTMLVGVAGSGKSTQARILEKHGAISVSSDAIRKELYGDENDQSHNQKVFEECHRRIKYLLKSGHWVVFDATNLSARRREAFLKQIRYFDCQKECIVMITPFETIMERMEKRERKVPMEVVHKQICGFQCPYYYEGWDKISIVWDLDCYDFLDEKYQRLCEETNNDNYHHSTETVSDHIDAAVLAFGINYSHREDIDFALIREVLEHHDIGKPQTKVFHNAKGEPTEEAHYYGHQNYSAYLYLIMHPYLFPDEAIHNYVCRVANLIQFHMEHFFRTEENLQKFYDKTGFGKELDIIHDCDMAGH